MEIKFEWETIGMFVDRAKVYGGWLVRTYGGANEWVLFIPDPEHEWEVEK
jgi:hypothetical protein